MSVNLHSRNEDIDRASVEICTSLSRISTEYTLTHAEIALILGHVILNYATIVIRNERDKAAAASQAVQ